MITTQSSICLACTHMRRKRCKERAKESGQRAMRREVATKVQKRWTKGLDTYDGNEPSNSNAAKRARKE